MSERVFEKDCGGGTYRVAFKDWNDRVQSKCVSGRERGLCGAHWSITEMEHGGWREVTPEPPKPDRTPGQVCYEGYCNEAGYEPQWNAIQIKDAWEAAAQAVRADAEGAIAELRNRVAELEAAMPSGQFVGISLDGDEFRFVASGVNKIEAIGFATALQRMALNELFPGEPSEHESDGAA